MDNNSTRRADLMKRPEQVAAMFDLVAKRYDMMNTLASAGQVHVWRKALANALRVKPGMTILDVAAGTGTSAQVLSDAGAEVIACDLSEGMIEVGRARHPNIDFVLGDATALPFADDQFDAVTISFGIRNVQNPADALKEMLRVTKPRGTLVVCEFSAPDANWFNQVYRWYLSTILPPIARAASSDDVAYDYLVESILDWPDQKHFGKMIKNSGWADVEYRSLSGGIVALHRGTKP